MLVADMGIRIDAGAPAVSRDRRFATLFSNAIRTVELRRH